VWGECDAKTQLRSLRASIEGGGGSVGRTEEQEKIEGERKRREWSGVLTTRRTPKSGSISSIRFAARLLPLGFEDPAAWLDEILWGKVQT